MCYLKRSSYITTLAGLLAMSLAINASALVQAQPTSSLLISRLPDELNFDPPTKGEGAPNGREGGATRPVLDCLKNKDNPVSLVPVSGEGWTVAEYPTIYWYLPPTKPETKMKFKLLKQQPGKAPLEIYSTTLPSTPGQQGIISVPIIPADAKEPLQIGQRYDWEVSLTCKEPPVNALENSENFGGSVVRVKPPTNLRISDTKRLQDRLAIYAKSGYWYDALDTLVKLRRLYPNDQAIKADWKKLLTSVQLEQTSENPVIIVELKNSVPQNTESKPPSPKPPSQRGAMGDRQ